MSDRSTLSVRVSRTLIESLDAGAEDLSTSRSELVRTLLREAVAEGDLDVPEHLRVIAEREKMKDANRVRDLRGGYSGRVKKQLHSRYHSGDYSAEDISEVAENYRREARILWPEWSESDYQEEREEALALVESQITKFDALEETADGVELDGGSDPEELETDADRLVSHHPRGRVISWLSERTGVDRHEAVEAVDAVDSTPVREETRSPGSSPTPEGEMTGSGTVNTGSEPEFVEDPDPSEDLLEEVEEELASGTAPNIVVSVVSAPEEEALAALAEVRSDPSEVSSDD